MATQPQYRRGIVLNLAHFDFDIVSDFDIRISDFSLSACPSCPACLPSTLVETPLQIHLFFAKQSQCQNGQYNHKYSKNKGLSQRTTNNEQRTLFKTNPIKPNFPAPPERPLQFPSQPEQAARRGNQAPNNQKSRRIAEQTGCQQPKLLIEPLQKEKVLAIGRLWVRIVELVG
jgi:hypothetical protein